LQDKITCSRSLKDQSAQKWLQFIEPVEQLLNAVLRAVHPELHEANRTTVSLLLNEPQGVFWPSIYPGLDLVANRETPAHLDRGGDKTYFDHLVNLGRDEDAKLCLDELKAQFAYRPGTSVLFSGSALTHSVAKCSKERVVIAHYSNKKVQERLGVEKPVLPIKLGWWTEHSQRQQADQ
jgi:hypothetical protein